MIILYFILYHIISCSIMLYHVISCYIILYHIISCYIMLYHIISYCIIYIYIYNYWIQHVPYAYTTRLEAREGLVSNSSPRTCCLREATGCLEKVMFFSGIQKNGYLLGNWETRLRYWDIYIFIYLYTCVCVYIYMCVCVLSYIDMI